jgi:hypothetical protein
MKAGFVGSLLVALLPLVIVCSPFHGRASLTVDEAEFTFGTRSVALYLGLQGNGVNFDSNPQQSPRQTVVRIAAYLVYWIVVPLILAIVFLYAVSLPYQTKDGAVKKAGTAGVFAGLILFVIFILIRGGASYEVSFTIPDYNLSFLSVVLLLVGAGLGFFVISVADAIRKSSAIAFLVMLLIAATLTATYSYFIYFGARSTIVYLAVGGIFGALIRVMVNPVLS